jgi:hypothetical protein
MALSTFGAFEILRAKRNKLITLQSPAVGKAKVCR